ncbi:MAG: PIN domain-containing protein [Clostridiales bacterium]|nr:PIN domain-containing protein [Clostridiales bacterium]
MLFDIINIEKVRKAIIYFGVTLLVLFVQNIVLSYFAVLGVHVFIAPVAVVAVGFFEGGIWGGAFGLITGLFCDMYFNETTVLMTVILSVIGFLSGASAMFIVNKRFFSYFFVSLAALIVVSVCQMFKFIAISDANILSALEVAGLQTLISLPFTYAVYYPCRAISGIDLSK